MPLIHRNKNTDWRLRAFACVASAAALLFAAPAKATVTDCNRDHWPIRTYSQWVVHPSPTFKAGDVLATANLTIDLNFRYVSGDDSYLSNGAIPNANLHPDFHAAPIPGYGGVGLRIRYGGTTTLRTNPADTAYIYPFQELDLGVPMRAVRGRSTDITRYVFSRPGVTYWVRQTWIYELVLTNEREYVGGTMNASRLQHDLGAGFQSKPAVGGNTDCQLLSVGMDVFQVTVGDGRPTLPVLPKPTCTFSTATVNQAVRLGPSDGAAVAASGAVRSAGAAGQVTFDIAAEDCVANARFRIYFTDQESPTNRTSTLGLLQTSINRNRVGIRLYHSASTTPLILGPVPTATAPGTNFIQVSAPNTGGNVFVPFTAQYVRYANVRPDDIERGPIAANAVVTIVYP